MQQSNQRRPVNCWDAWWVSVTDNTESSSQFFIEISPFNFHDLLKCMFEIFPRPKFANTFTSHSLNNSTFVRNIPLAEETQQSTVQIGSDFSLSWRQLTGRWFVGCNRIEKKPRKYFSRWERNVRQGFVRSSSNASVRNAAILLCIIASIHPPFSAISMTSFLWAKSAIGWPSDQFYFNCRVQLHSVITPLGQINASGLQCLVAHQRINQCVSLRNFSIKIPSTVTSKFQPFFKLWNCWIFKNFFCELNCIPLFRPISTGGW